MFSVAVLKTFGKASDEKDMVGVEKDWNMSLNVESKYPLRFMSQ